MNQCEARMKCHGTTKRTRELGSPTHPAPSNPTRGPVATRSVVARLFLLFLEPEKALRHRGSAGSSDCQVPKSPILGKNAEHRSLSCKNLVHTTSIVFLSESIISTWCGMRSLDHCLAPSPGWSGRAHVQSPNISFAIMRDVWHVLKEADLSPIRTCSNPKRSSPPEEW